MSWSFDFKAADKDEAKAMLDEQAELHADHFPAEIAGLIEIAIDALPSCEDSDISVSTYGHFNCGEHRSTSNLLIKVENHFKAAPAGLIKQPADEAT